MGPGLKHLKGLTKLQSLIPANSQVTNAGLEHLKGLIHLQSLDLADTKISNEGVRKLQEALPRCEIKH
jgi:hypothetical protein